MTSEVIELTQQLIAVASITPDDQNCQAILIKRLEKLGFQVQSVPSGKVSNFWAQRQTAKPLFVFAGHTDVVPTGDLNQWSSPPFQAQIREGYLYGRGAADMKGALAAMVIACERFIETHPQHAGSIGFLITSGEEGDDFLDGTPKVMQYLADQNIQIDCCIVGEPSSSEQLADTIRVGRRGSITAKLTVRGKQGHVAYPHLANNPIHSSAQLLSDLVNIVWDQGDDYFPPTSLQITNIHAGTGAGNVIPGDCDIDFNLRFSPLCHAEQIQQTVQDCVEKHTQDFSIDWMLNGEPFLTQECDFVLAVESSIEQVTGLKTIRSTSGGTSDARFIAPYQVDVIELGPINKTIHQIDECVAVADLEQLVDIYLQLLKTVLT